MKKIVIMMAIACASVGSAMAMEEGRDTVKVVNNAKNVIITEGAEGVNVTIMKNDGEADSCYTYKSKYGKDGVVKTEQRDWELRLPFGNEKEDANGKKVKWNYITGGLGFGWSYAGNSEFNMGKSWELFLKNIIAIQCQTRPGQSFMFGFGLSLKDYRLEKQYRFVKNGDVVETGDYAEGVSPDKSRLSVVSFMFPLTYRQRIYKGLCCSMSAIMNISPTAYYQSKYAKDNVEYEETYKKIHQKVVSCDLMGTLSLSGLGLYVKYSPSSLIKEGYGPKIKPLSVGIILGI